MTPSFGLTATFNGRRFFDRQRLDGWGGESYDAKRGWGGHKWAPADGWGGDDGWGRGWRPKADWRFVVGAHTSSWTDRHVIDTLRLRLGALVDASDVALEMSANGQQFTASANPFAYFPTPFVSFATPAAGPAAGGTLVAVVGARLGTSEQLHRRFNGTDAVPASYARQPGCSSPPRPATATPTIRRRWWRERSIRCSAARRRGGRPPGLRLAQRARLFGDVSDLHAVRRARPRERPPVVGANRRRHRARAARPAFAAGANSTRFCSFGPLGVVVAHVISPTHLACLAPPADGLVGGEGPVVLEVTLNDQDYTTSAVNFSYYSPVAVSSLSPQSGPVGGDTLVRLSGAFSEFGSSYNCSFALDEPPVPATREGPESLVCHAPPMQAGTRNVSVSLNAHDYAASPKLFSAYAPPKVMALSPASGPLGGATRVVVSGIGFRGAFDDGGPRVTCRFNTTAVDATVDRRRHSRLRRARRARRPRERDGGGGARVGRRARAGGGGVAQRPAVLAHLAALPPARAAAGRRALAVARPRVGRHAGQPERLRPRRRLGHSVHVHAREDDGGRAADCEPHRGRRRVVAVVRGPAGAVQAARRPSRARLHAEGRRERAAPHAQRPAVRARRADVCLL